MMRAVLVLLAEALIKMLVLVLVAALIRLAIPLSQGSIP